MNKPSANKLYIKYNSCAFAIEAVIFYSKITFSSYYKLQTCTMDWYLINNIRTIDTPALVVYKQRVQDNINRAISMVGDVERLRPHAKTNKIAEVCSMMMDAGITKFKCATIAEAEMLGMVGAKDVLLAYQPFGPKLQRLYNLTQKYPGTKFSCLVDNIETAYNIGEVFKTNNDEFNVYIDLNTGMNRSGIKPGAAFELYGAAKEIKGINIIGLHGYDGHIRDTNVDERQHKADGSFNQIKQLQQDIESRYGVTLKIVTSGSPTFPTHAHRQGIECSPGTFVFWDWGYKTIVPDEPFEPAALVVTRVVSIIDETTIATDLGHKSVAAENPLPRVYFLNAPEITPIGQSEEHLVAKVQEGNTFKVGDVLYGIPVHICPTVALYERAFVAEGNNVVSEWKVIARDRKITV